MLKGSDADLPKRIVFDHLNFDSATTHLTPESDATVNNLVAIMKCYPTMQVRLEGHTTAREIPPPTRRFPWNVRMPSGICLSKVAWIHRGSPPMAGARRNR
jgi:hypothetical protein